MLSVLDAKGIPSITSYVERENLYSIGVLLTKVPDIRLNIQEQ